MVLNSSYGDGVKITRVEGSGNGGGNLEFTQNTIENILSNSDHRSLYPTYEAGQGPITVSVVDPTKIEKGSYLLKLENPILNNANSITSYSSWILQDSTSGDIVAT